MNGRFYSFPLRSPAVSQRFPYWIPGSGFEIILRNCSVIFSPIHHKIPYMFRTLSGRYLSFLQHSVSLIRISLYIPVLVLAFLVSMLNIALSVFLVRTFPALPCNASPGHPDSVVLSFFCLPTMKKELLRFHEHLSGKYLYFLQLYLLSLQFF